MSNRYNDRENDNIQNTDNEDTVLLPNDLEGYGTPKSDLPPLRKVNRRASTQAPQQSVKPQSPQYRSTDAPPQFPKTGQPPRFPQSTPPPQPQQQFDYSDRRYYDYERQSPQEYGSTSSGGGGYAPPPPMAPQSPRPQPTGGKKPSAPHHEEEAPRKKKKKRRHKSLVGRIIRRIIHIILILFLLLFGIYSCTSVCLIRQVNQEPTGHRNHYADSVGKGHVRNVLVIGTDGRTADDRGRSDSMILVSLNRKTNEIIMTSFMRDSYVEIPDNGWNKLNAAYAFGGPELLMDTIEYNFDVCIDDYVSVDFVSFVSLVDAVGGIDLEVSDAEAEEINVILISEVNELVGDDRMSDLLNGGGKLHLNGKQALSYSRIRKVGNSDFERTERQRRVMSLIFSKIKSFRPSMFKNLASDVIPDVSTNMSGANMYLLSLRMPFCARYKVKQIQIPADGTFHGEDVDVGNVLWIDDIEGNRQIIENEVFAESK